MGTACFVHGAETLLSTVERVTGAHPGQRTADGSISFETARCIGTCGLAPLAVFDGVVCGHLTPEAVRDRLRGWSEHESPE
jgi:bidirectional [NiFe] hydrogenase diaphorase subunit